MTGIIIMDKPAGWTSHDVVAKLRRVLKEKRIGHGGTLDPMATGVLPLFAGRATRAVEFAESADKEYIAGFRLGVVTDTQDTTGTVLEQHEVTASEDEICSAVKALEGEHMQLPPLYSAVKVGGKKLYQYAREGKDVERSPRRIVISQAEPLGMYGGEFRFRVVCSKGTYVRTLCHELGMQLGCGAAMSSLRRTRAGEFTLKDAVSMDEAIQRGADVLLPVDTIFRAYPAITVSREDEGRIRCGASPQLEAGDGRVRVYGQNGDFLALAEVCGGTSNIIKSFFEV